MNLTSICRRLWFSAMILCCSSARVLAFFSAWSNLRFSSASIAALRIFCLELAAFRASCYLNNINYSACSRFSYFIFSASSYYFFKSCSLVIVMFSLMLFFMFWLRSRSIRSSSSFSRLLCSLILTYSWFLYLTCIISLAFFLVSSIFFHAYTHFIFDR